MKSFIYSFKSWLVLMVSGLLVLMLVFACSTPESKPDSDGTSTADRSDDDDEGDDDEEKFACSLPKCSGSKCCNKGSKKDKDQCKEWCSGGKYLDLPGSASSKDSPVYRCLSLGRDYVKRLVELFSDKGLKDVEEDKLKKIEEEDIGPICAAVRELDVELLENIIEDYSDGNAESILGWIAQEEKAIQIFKNTKKDEDGIKMFQSLLEKFGSDSDESGMLNGLEADIDFAGNENKNLLALALKSRNDDLVNFVHDEILKDKNEGLCGDKRKNSYPVPKEGDSALETPTGYGECTGSCTAGGDDDPGAYISNANSKKQQACLLAVYCNKVAEGSDEDSVREDIAVIVKDSGIEKFIKDALSKGGLGFTTGDEKEEWPNTVCERLNALWNDASPDVLKLGLGS